MTTAAKKTFGNEVWMAPAGQTLVKVAELLTFNPPVQTRGTQDVTTHDSAGGAMEFIGEGVYDPGTITGQVHYTAGSTGDDAFLTALASGDLYDFKVVVKAATGTEDMTFSAIITSYGPDDQPVQGKQAASWEAKVSGVIAQDATA